MIRAADEIPGEDQVNAPSQAMADAAVRAGHTAFDAWQKEVASVQDVAVRNLTFVEVLPSRGVQHILRALARIYARLRSLGLPLYRLHCDRARELISAPVRRWTLDRSIVTTLTSGDSYKSNGRVEGDLGVIKKTCSNHHDLHGFGPQPVAIGGHPHRRTPASRTTQKSWSPRWTFAEFGAKAYALKKSWRDRYQPWRTIRDEVQVLGPALQSSVTSQATMRGPQKLKGTSTRMMWWCQAPA